MIKPGMLISERYEIIDKVGSGGMADVYKAKDHRLNRMVAIKILKQEYSNDTKFVSKFRAEAQSVAGLSHQNVVNVYDVGEDDGLYYIVMELVEGITLKNFIERKGKLTVKESIGIAIQIAQGMQAAHDNHIIHRDIKPQNIIISKEGKVKVTDFGIAKAATSNTITSNAMGSVHYISPEQARGGYSDEKSDIYSLGVTLYEMLSGHVPFTGDSTVTVALAHIQDEAASLTEADESIPVSLDRIVKKCMQKKPDRRYPTAEALINDLKRALMQPGGEYVQLASAIPDDSPTIKLEEDELEEIRSATRTVAPIPPEEELPEVDAEETPEDEEEVDPKLERLLLIGSGIVAVIIVAILLLIVVYFFGGCSNKSKKPQATKKPTATATATTTAEAKEMVKVPGVVGKDKEEAATILIDAGLKVSYKYKESDKKEGQVLEQDPAEGEEVQENSTVTLTVSKSESKIILDDLAGYTKADALETLTSLGLETTVKTESSESVEEGKVIRTEPGAGSEVEKGDTVTVVVSGGSDLVKVPNLKNLTEEEAIEVLSDSGLEKGKVTYKFSDTVEEGKVITQSQTEGSKVERGTKVSFTVSKGPKATVTATPEPSYSYYGSVQITANPFSSPDEPAQKIDFVLEQDGNRVTVRTVTLSYSDFPYTLDKVKGSSANNGTIYVYKNGEQVGSAYNIEFSKVAE